MAALFRTERGVPYASIEGAGRMAAESLLVITVGVLLGRLAWGLLAPSDTSSPAAGLTALTSEPTTSVMSSRIILTQMNPFAHETGAVSDPGVLNVETTLELKLSGVRSVSGHTTASSAVISLPGGEQKRFVPGDEVLPGVVLVNVTPDAIHLSRDGVLETLSLYPGRAAPFSPGYSSPPEASATIFAAVSPPENAEVTPSALASDTVLTPEFRSGRVSGYKVEPRGAGTFEAAGLQSGDLILRINGEAIEGLRPDQISHTVSSSSDVALDVVRQGAIVRLRVAPGAGFSQ
jgi:general secretion pathway protein C